MSQDSAPIAFVQSSWQLKL